MIKSKSIVAFVLSIIYLFLFSILLFLEIGNLQRVILPFLFSGLFSAIIYLTLNCVSKNKFISKIFLISILLHFVFILFWQILKYYILGLQMPTEYHFNSFIVDNDGAQYHYIGSILADGYNLNIFSEKLYGGLFPKLVATIYYYFGKNPFIVTCFHSIISSFIPILLYKISKPILKNPQIIKIYVLLCIFCTSYIVNTSVLIRDVYIVLFIYLSIYLSYRFYKLQNILYAILTILSLYALYLFRPYAAFIVLISIFLTNIFVRLKSLHYKKGVLSANKITVIVTALSPVLIVLFVALICYFANYMNMFSVEDLMELRESGYTGSNSDYSWDFGSLYSICPLLPFLIGYVCLTFAPFPWEWVFVKRLHFVPDMLILYTVLPSFFKNIKRVFKEKQYYLVCFIFTIVIMFAIYSITVGNSGTIHRLRGPFIPMIYLIAMSRPDKFLSRILNKIQKWRLL